MNYFSRLYFTLAMRKRTTTILFSIKKTKQTHQPFGFQKLIFTLELSILRTSDTKSWRGEECVLYDENMHDDMLTRVNMKNYWLVVLQ